jgi:hypothetical protein
MLEEVSNKNIKGGVTTKTPSKKDRPKKLKLTGSSKPGTPRSNEKENAKKKTKNLNNFNE